MTQLIVVFLLFFAVLAFGYFYLQRAKTRGTPSTTTSTDETSSTPPSDPTA